MFRHIVQLTLLLLIAHHAIFAEQSSTSWTHQEQTYLKQLGQIKLCVGPDTLPLETIDNGKHVGMNAEYMSLFQKRLPIPIKLIITSTWEESMESIQLGKCDIISLAGETPERKSFLYFTEKYVEIPFVVVTTQEKFFISRLSSLATSDKKLGVIKGYSYVDLLRARYPEMQIIEVSNRLEGLKKVNNGEFFGFFSGLHLAGYAIQEHGFTSLKINGQFDELSKIQLGIGVRKDRQPLVDIFNRLITELTDEQKKQIENSWRRVKFDISEDFTRTIQITIFMSVLLTSALLWLFQIRKHSRQLKKNEQVIWKQAHFDYLTELPNRRLFQDRLSQLLKQHERRPQRFALLLIDLDGFKEVNDSMGHDQGDLLLKKVTERLLSCIRKSDSLSRLGGDEFTVVINNLSENISAEYIAQKMLEVLTQPFYLNDSPIYISASIGITLFPNDYTEHADTTRLLKNADQAMYEAKSKGKNQFHYFTKAMHQAALNRMSLLTDIRQGIENDEFELFYQPIINLNSEKIEKAEALVRWLSPTRGMVAPDTFISLLEETRLINDLGNELFHQALNFLEEVKQNHNADLEVSLNVSPVQLKLNKLQGWHKKLSATKNITLEVTESMVMEQGVANTLIELRNNGFKISLDDFGVGYSSLSYLRQFPFDYLKIDRSFIQTLTKNSDEYFMCEAIIKMAHQLNLKVIAEGIETEEQKQTLKDLGCDYAQGYLFSKPLPKTEFINLLS